MFNFHVELKKVKIAIENFANLIVTCGKIWPPLLQDLKNFGLTNTLLSKIRKNYQTEDKIYLDYNSILFIIGVNYSYMKKVQQFDQQFINIKKSIFDLPTDEIKFNELTQENIHIMSIRSLFSDINNDNATIDQEIDCYSTNKNDFESHNQNLNQNNEFLKDNTKYNKLDQTLSTLKSDIESYIQQVQSLKNFKKVN